MPAWTSSSEFTKMWDAPFGVLTDNPFAGTRDRLDFCDTFDFPNFFANFVFWLLLMYPTFLSMRAFFLQWQAEREYSRREKTL